MAYDAFSAALARAASAATQQAGIGAQGVQQRLGHLPGIIGEPLSRITDRAMQVGAEIARLRQQRQQQQQAMAMDLANLLSRQFTEKGRRRSEAEQRALDRAWEAEQRALDRELERELAAERREAQLEAARIRAGPAQPIMPESVAAPMQELQGLVTGARSLLELRSKNMIDEEPYQRALADARKRAKALLERITQDPAATESERAEARALYEGGLGWSEWGAEPPQVPPPTKKGPGWFSNLRAMPMPPRRGAPDALPMAEPGIGGPGQPVHPSMVDAVRRWWRERQAAQAPVAAPVMAPVDGAAGAMGWSPYDLLMPPGQTPFTATRDDWHKGLVELARQPLEWEPLRMSAAPPNIAAAGLGEVASEWQFWQSLSDEERTYLDTIARQRRSIMSVPQAIQYLRLAGYR